MNKSFLVPAALLFLAASPIDARAQTRPSPNLDTTNWTEPNSEAASLYEEGVKRVEAGEVSEGVERFQKAVALDPEYAEAYSALGRAYFKLGQWQNAIDNLRRATALKRERQDTLQRKRPRRTEPSVPDLPATNTVEISASQRNVDTASPRTSNSPAAAGPQLQHQNDDTAVATLRDKKSDANSVAPQVTTQTPVPAIHPLPTTAVDLSETALPANISAANPIDSTPGKTVINLDNSTVPVNAVAIDYGSADPPPYVATPTLPPDVEKLNPPELHALVVNGDGAIAITSTLSDGDDPVWPKASAVDDSLTKIYRVGPGDVLDVQLNGSQTKQSTLYTITPTGLLEYPMLAEPLTVKGLTVDEIAAKIQADLERRAIVENPKVVVGVRDYGSHALLVSGLVKEPGTKLIRREAIPLYVVIADALPLPDAARVTVVRNESNDVFDFDLSQAGDLNFLVRPGDVITVGPSIIQCVYIGGQVKFPGEKKFRRGLTLTQAILTAGGTLPKSQVAEVARDDGKGFLVQTRYILKEIETGKTADPALKPGDRVTILR